jgi:polyisoprenoid-binding protein YceI
MRRALSVLLSLAACSTLAFAEQAYVVDDSNSRATFFIRHFTETVQGSFSDISGSITYDPSDVRKSRVHVVINIASVDTGKSQRDSHLQGNEFFDARHFPQMIFDSQRVEQRPSGLVAIGNLTMRGTTRPIEIPFTLILTGDDDPYRRIAIHGSTSLNRRDYNVGSEEIEDNQLTIGNEVRVELDLYATASR